MNDPTLIHIDDPARALLSAVGRIDPRSIEILGIEETLRRCEAFLADLQKPEEPNAG